jgi:dTDP-4-amino-4,6-dideoxygalactose transaminase
MTDLAARHAAVAPAVEDRVLAVLRSGAYVGGPVVAEAEALVARWFGRRGAVGVNGGTDALILALQAVGVSAGDEVVVPALSFFATAGAVCALGAVPVVADVLPADGTLDPEAAARVVGPRTRAIVPVHLFGSAAAHPAVDLPIIDDAAQSVGGDSSPCTGTLVAVSTYPTKTWGAAGDGGFVIGDDLDLLERVRRLGNHGAIGPHQHVAIGGHVGRNSRLDAVQAAILLGHAGAVPQRVARRRAVAARYDAELPRAFRPLARSPGSAVHQYAVCVRDRDAVRVRLAEMQVETAIYYPRPLQRQPALAGRARGDTPVADALCAELLALPIHDSLTDVEASRVIEACALVTR